MGATQAGDGVADAGPPMGGAGRVDGPAMLRWMMRCVVVFALMSGVSHSSGAVRYVRAGGNNALDGDSPETAWGTVAYAASRVAPGDTVYVGAGSYGGRVSLTDLGQHNAVPVRFIADTEGTHTGDAGAVEIVSGEVAIALQRAGGVEFHGFRVRNAGTPATLVNADNSRGVTLEGCVLEAGGAAVRGQNDYSLVVRDCTVSSEQGHAFYLQGGAADVTGTTVTGVGPTHSAVYPMNFCVVTVDRCSLLDGYDAVSSSGATVTLRNTVIANARRHAVHVVNNTQLTLVHCTVADAAGSGVRADGGSQTIRNTIFAGLGGNAIIRLNMSGMSVAGCLFFDYTGALANGITVADALEGDPLFVDPSNNLYTLSDGSPAIDAGVDASAFTTVDRIGRARPAGTGWDVGAYEGVGGVEPGEPEAGGGDGGDNGGGGAPARRRVVRWREVSPLGE